MEFQTVDSKFRRNLLYPNNWNYIHYSVGHDNLLIFSVQLPNVLPFNQEYSIIGTFSLKYFEGEAGTDAPADTALLKTFDLL